MLKQNLNSRQKTIRYALLLILIAISAVRLWPVSRGPLYEGRHLADWVELSLHEDARGPASEIVLRIGAPAVPFIVREGLHGTFHHHDLFTEDSIARRFRNHPKLYWLISKFPWGSYDGCAFRHSQATWLLNLMGTNAISAVPDLIDCFESCEGLHFVPAQDIVDALGAVSGHDPIALPFLTKLTKRADSFALRAAANAYYIDDKTNLFVTTCERLASIDPKVLDGFELYWFREDHALNEHIVPLLERMYNNPRATADRDWIMSALNDRSNDATAAIARLTAQGGQNSEIRGQRSEGSRQK